MFPNLSFSNSTNHLINYINTSYLAKKFYSRLEFKLSFMPILIFFKKINFINNYSILTNKHKTFILIRYFYYKTFKLIKNFKLISKKTTKYSISLKSLNLLSKRTGASFYLISTNKGLMTHKEALEKKTTGHIIGFFYN